MPILLLEGPRKSGKTYLASQQNILPVFKFHFNKNFETWNFSKKEEKSSLVWIGERSNVT